MGTGYGRFGGCIGKVVWSGGVGGGGGGGGQQDRMWGVEGGAGMGGWEGG